MADQAFNAACDRIAAMLFPKGIDAHANAPNTFADLANYWHTTGRMCVTDEWSRHDHPAFDNKWSYRNFRAWHDWTHLMWDCQFTLEGECRAAAIQHDFLASLYGQETANRWMATLQDELVINNFGECASCQSKPS